MFDFALLLVVLTLVTGVVWALDRWLWRPRREAAGEGEEQVPGWVDFCRSFFPVILVVLLLRSFVVEPFRIPSASMLPTLHTGDFILVNKFSYGLRLPVLNTRIVPGGEPQRGDVMVFRYPEDPSVDFIKRVVGLPGDEVMYRDSRLYINGEQVPLEPLGPYEGPLSDIMALQRYHEKLTQTGHDILLAGVQRPASMRYVVGEDEYFVMGDNRDNSDDSRRWGAVPEDMLVGRAFVIWMNWDRERMRPAWERIGNRIE